METEKMALTTFAEAKAELLSEIQNYEATLDNLEEALGEYVDSALPVYNFDIIADWQEMPGEYDGRGAAELGMAEPITVYSIMIQDLYVYYYDLYAEALIELRNELESEAA